jgi:hypothetical protein
MLLLLVSDLTGVYLQASQPSIVTGILSTVTGGSVFFHPRFDAARDRTRVNDEISRVLVRDIAYNVAIRIRCSNG